MTTTTDRIITPPPTGDAELWGQLDAYLDGIEERHAREIDLARRDATARALAHLAGTFTDRAQAVPDGPRAAGLTTAAIATLAFRDRVLEHRDGVL